MKCDKCSEKAVYTTTGQAYCKLHFIDYFEKKVLKTIKKFKLIEQGDKVCVATSGGKDSLSVLYMTMKYCRKQNIDFFALAIDEGIQDYRDHTLDDLDKYCNQYNIELKVLSFKKTFGETLDNLTEKAIKQFGKKPCTVCGILRRTLLNKGSRALGATKLVTGHNLD
ncbi:MAG: ATP-binding protein, partial [Nanoarchaeota archaeon]